MKTTSIIPALFAAATLVGCSEFHLSDNPNALRIRTMNMADDTFKIIASADNGVKVSGRVEIYDEYNKKVRREKAKPGEHRHFRPDSHLPV